jgi:AbrB family looped-hinge helix DNA binding protein
MQTLIAMHVPVSLMVLATITGRGMMHIPADLRKRFGIRPGDKVELRPTREGILLERIPSLMEGFGKYPGIGKRIAIELLEEKKAELAREERALRAETERIRRSPRGENVRV